VSGVERLGFRVRGWIEGLRGTEYQRIEGLGAVVRHLPGRRQGRKHQDSPESFNKQAA
jgi:hypothetical protein